MLTDDRRNLTTAATMAPVETGIPALTPEELAPMAEAAVAALLREGESVNTQASYRSALRYWAAWFALRYRRAIELPVASATVLQFIVDHVERSTDEGLAYELPEAIDAPPRLPRV